MSEKTTSPDTADHKATPATAAAAAPAAAPTSGAAEAKPGRGVHLTERAAKEIQRVIDEQKFAGPVWVRIGAKGGGCSGFTYVLDFDQSGPTEFDLTFTQHGVQVVVDKKSEFFMGGTTLDFNDGLLDRGFTFKNPLASGSCGCGTSFSA